MTEKSYGGNNGVREHLGGPAKGSSDKPNKTTEKKIEKLNKVSNKITKEINKEIDNYIKAGEIAIKVKEFARNLIKKDMLLVDIAKKIEEKTYELGGEPAFPVNLSINEVAAHYHPTLEDETKANGLLKVDLGIHIKGFIADTSFSLDLTDDKRYASLIKASEEALENALKLLDKDPTLNDIGKTIQEAIEKRGFSPIVNLSGHSLAPYTIHAGETIPNHANNSPHKIDPGAYAIEPFATTGEGKIHDGPPSNIYRVANPRTPRGPTARKILEYIWTKKQTLPFSLRELQEEFGNISKLGLKELIDTGIVHSYPQLIEISKKPVSQAEHTFIKTPDNKIIITTR
jgi:methionyl aminopeptidase